MCRYYTWSSYPNGQGSNLDFAPLLWGKNDVSTWTSAINGSLKPMFQSQAITSVLGFNEYVLPLLIYPLICSIPRPPKNRPQETSGANLTVAEAKTLWMANILPLKTTYGVRLGTPATSSAPSGKNWTAQFLSLCGTECGVDFVALRES
jgi:hypothetical protein